MRLAAECSLARFLFFVLQGELSKLHEKAVVQSTRLFC